MSDGSHTKLKTVEFFRVSSFILRPDGGLYDVSGESAPSVEEVRCDVLPSVLRVLG